jgi:hypothetical protein
LVLKVLQLLLVASAGPEVAGRLLLLLLLQLPLGLCSCSSLLHLFDWG